MYKMLFIFSLDTTKNVVIYYLTIYDLLFSL